MKNTATFRELVVIRFFDPMIMKWNPRTAPVLVREVSSNEIFTLYESQLKRIPAGKDEKGQPKVILGYIMEKGGMK